MRAWTIVCAQMDWLSSCDQAPQYSILQVELFGVRSAVHYKNLHQFDFVEWCGARFPATIFASIVPAPRRS